MAKNYISSINSLIHVGNHNEKNHIIITDDYDAALANNKNDLINSQLRVLKNIWTPKLSVNEITTTENSNILKIGQEDKCINLINKIGINTEQPIVSLDINNTDGIKIPIGLTNQRPSIVEKGIIRYNSELDQFEGYGVGNNWGSLGGVIDSNQDTFIRAERIPGLDNNELEFYTSSNERMIIKADGKVGIGTSNPRGIFEINNKLLIDEEKIEFSKSLIPNENNTLNIGSAKNTISELFLAKDSIWIDDLHHLIVKNGDVKFTKRKTNVVPESILTLGGNESNVLTFTSKSDLSNINLTEWLNYGKTLDSNLKLKEIFNNESEIKQNVYTWIENNNDIYFNNQYSNIGIGTTNPTVSLDINRTDAIKIPIGSNNERPTYLQKGLIRFNTDLDQFEGYGVGNNWGSLGGVKDVNQDTFIRAERSPGLDNNELEFYTSNNERMIIKDDGKIGINVSIPTHQLHVKGTTRIEGDLIVNGVQHIIDTDTSTTEQLKITNDGTGPALILNQLSAQPIIDFQDNSNSILFIKDDGNIGIKTNEPNISLHINTTDGIILPKGTTNERPEYLEKGIIRYNTELDQFEGYGIGNNWGSLGGVIDSNQDTFIRAERIPGLDNNELEFYTSNNERMIIKSDGKIGIGTSEPSETLEVIGNIRISGLIYNDYLDNKYYTQDHIDINFIGLNYNLNKLIYNSDKDESIIGWYRFDNNYSIGEDSSVTKNSLNLYGSNFYLSDIIKKNGKNSIAFTEDYQYLKTSKTIDLFDYWDTNNGFSITFWSLITDTTPSNISLFGLDYDNFALYYDNKLKLRVNGNDLTLQTNIVFNENEWYHHSIVFEKNQNNTTNVYYYIDKFKYTLCENIELLITTNLNSKYTIGYIPNTPIFITNIFNGYFDDIRFFNKVLDDTDVLNTFNDIDVYFKPYTLQSLGQLEMGINKIPIFLNDTVSGTVDFLNELDLISDSIVAIPTQHSVKTYVDVSSSNLYELLRLKPGCITNELLAGDITDNKLYERYFKTSDLINLQTSIYDILQIENGGTGGSNIIDARSNLGLAIDTDVQAYNARLQSLSQQPGEYNKIPIFNDNSNFRFIDFVDDDDMVLNSCNAIPTQQNIKNYIEKVIKNFTTDVLKINIKTVNLADINTDIIIKYNDCIFYLTLDIDYYLLGASITQQYINFINNIRENLSILLNIPTDDIIIQDLYLGSIKFKIKVKSTTIRNSAVNIHNFYLNYDSLLIECNIDTNIFSNIDIDIDTTLSNQAFDTNKRNLYVMLNSDTNYNINISDIIETPYLKYTIESNIYSNVSYNILKNTITLDGNYRNSNYDVIVNIEGLTTFDNITLKITEVEPILVGYADSNMTIIIGNDTKEINLREKFIGPQFNLIQLIQTSEFTNVNYINNTLYEIKGNFRNTTYDIIWSGTQENEELLPDQINNTVEWKLTVIELPPIPIKIFSDIDYVFINQVKTYNLTAIFSGVDLIYRIIKNPYNSALISNELLSITSDSRGVSYEIIIEAKNASKLLNWKVQITENKPNAPIVLLNNESISLADEYYIVELCNVFVGKHLEYDYSVYYNHILNSNILENNNFLNINEPWSRYHARNYNKYTKKIFNIGINNTDLELVEGNIYEGIENNIAYIYGDKDTVMKFKMPNTANYTICALLKYNGSNKGTILGNDTSFIGHWNQIKGFGSINNTNLTSISGLNDNEDWLIVLFNNSEISPNNLIFYPTSQDIVSTATEKQIFDYLYINKQKNSDWALADLLIFNKRLDHVDNTTIINIFKSYLLNTDNSLQNFYKLKDISVFLNNFSLDSNLVIIDANNIGISYNINLIATNTCNNIDWTLTINEDEYIHKNTDIYISTGIYYIGLKYLFNTYCNLESNISINTNSIFEIHNDELILYPKYREIPYIIELNNGESNFVIEVQEEAIQKPKLLNNNYYGIKTGITYLSNIIDNFDNNKTTINITKNNENYYLSGIDMNSNYDNVIINNVLLEVEQSNIIDITLTNNTFLPKHNDDIVINVITDIYNNYILSGTDSINTIFNNSLSYGTNNKTITVIKENTLTLNVNTFLPNYTCNIDINLNLNLYNKYSLSGTDGIGTIFNNTESYTNNVKTIKIIKNTILSLAVNTTTNNPFIIVKSDTNPERIFNDSNKYSTGITYPINNYKTDEGQITGTIIWDTTNSELGTYHGISINTLSMYFKIELISSNNLLTIVKSDNNPDRINNDSNKYINDGLIYNGNYITGFGFTDGIITWNTSNNELGTYYVISPYDINMYFIIELIMNNNLFVIVKSDTNIIRTNSDINRYINSNLIYNGSYEDGYGLINGIINWDTSTSEIGRYYYISTYDINIYCIIDVISQLPIKYITEFNMFEINNDDITSDLTIYKLLAHNSYGTSLLRIKFIKDSINNDVLTQNIINLELAISEIKEINLFNYKYANNYTILNNPDPINIVLTNNILTIQNTTPSTYDLQVEMDDYVFILRIKQN